MENMNINSKRETESEISILEIWEAIRKHICFIMGSFLTVVLLTGIYTFFFIPKQYQSYVIFYIQQKNQNGLLSVFSSQLPSGLGGMIPGNTDTNTDLCSEIILAPSFIKNVLEAQGLPNSWKAVERFSKRVKVEKKLPSNALKVSVLYKNPTVAYELTQKIFADYKKFVDEQINHNNSKNRQFIEKQYEKSKMSLKKAEDKLLQYELSKGTVILPETTEKTIEYYADLEKQKAQIDIELNNAQQRLTTAGLILNKKAPQVKENVFQSVNPLIEKYKEKLTELEVELAKARQTLTDEHPTVKNLLRQITELGQQIQTENSSLNAPDIAGDYMKGLVEVAGLEAQKRSINQLYGKLDSRMGTLPKEMMTYGRLVRQQKVAEQIYIMLESQLEQAKISEAKDDNVVIQIIQPAIIPYKKYSPKIMINAAIAGLLTLFIGIGWVLYKENLIQ